jgi:succinate dehydrogenase/fumarate reductase cytochrome b subunit
MSSSSPTLIRIQALSGIAFSAFLSLHLANTASAIVSAGSYDAFQAVARRFYQNVFVELSLVAVALVVHVAVSLVLVRRRKAGRVPLELRLHRYSGYVLLAFVFTHVLATRGAALLQGLPVSGQYVTFTFATWPAFFYPYYALFFAAGACHLLSGLRFALGRLALPRLMRVKPPAVYATIVGAIGLGLLGIAALGGLVRPVAVPARSAYERYFESFAPPALLPWHSRSNR